MDYSQWDITKHAIPASHIRGYRRGVRDERTALLKLSVNEYRPKSDEKYGDDAVTIVFIHGVGSTKESYEPFFQQLKSCGLVVRSVWAADIAWHGKSTPRSISV
jgi:pimeloyl-ACP methyl ester carboxylesterase